MGTQFIKTNWGWVIAVASLVITIIIQTVKITQATTEVSIMMIGISEAVKDIKETIKPGMLPISQANFARQKEINVEHERRLERLERIVLYQNRTLLDKPFSEDVPYNAR